MSTQSIQTMDLLQKSSNLIEHQRKKRARLMREDEFYNRIHEARNQFLKARNIDPKKYAEQEIYFKAIQKHFHNLCQRPLLLPREFVHVEILSGVSPKELFILKKYDLGQVNEVHREFEEEYANETHQAVYCIKVGIICAANTSTGWRRCRILKLHENFTCDALCIDIGMKVRVNWDDLRTLTGKWIDIKPLAIRCSLVTVTSANLIERFTLKQQEVFTSILQTERDFYVFVNRSDAISSDVFLYYQRENNFYCVNEIFPSESFSDDSSYDETEISMRNGYRTPLNGISSQPDDTFHIDYSSIQTQHPTHNDSNENSRELQFVDDNSNVQKPHRNGQQQIQNANRLNLKVEDSEDNGRKEADDSPFLAPQMEKLLSKPEPVFIKHIEGIDKIYVCFEKYSPGLNKLRFEIQNYIKNVPCEAQIDWKIDDPCVVFDTFDGIGEWLRGRIVSTSLVGTCGVYLRDVGKIIEKPMSDLKPITDNLHKIRDFTWKMKLSSIKLENGCQMEMINNSLYNIVSSFESVAISALNDGDGEWSVILWGIRRGTQALLPETLEYININEELVKQHEPALRTQVSFDGINHLINELVQTKCNEYEETEDIERPTTEKYTVTDQVEEVDHWLPAEPIFKREFVAFPMYVTQGCLLSVLEANRKTTAEEIQIILNKKNRAKELVKRNPFDWKKEDACFARFTDKNFYRASVRRVNIAKNTCVVRYIDYGNCETILMDDLRLANMFGDIPALAKLYQMENIKPPNDGGVWPDYVSHFCTQLVYDKQCNLVVTELVSGSKSSSQPDLCKLELYTKERDLGTALVKRGYAEWIHPAEG